MHNQPLVTHVIPTLARAGAERIAIELCARLPARGFRTHLLVLYEHGDLWRELRERNIRFTQVGGSFDMSRLDLYQRLSQRIYAEPERRPAIVHSHLYGPDVFTAVVRTVHAAGHLFAKRCSSEPSYLSTIHNVDRDDTSIQRAARAWGARHMDRVVAVSKDVQRFVTEDLGVNKDRVTQIDGMILPVTRPRGARPFNSVPQFLMVARLEPQKGHDTVLQALSLVQSPWELRLVGTGSLERDLKEQAERLGIASRVHFVGEIDNVPEELERVDLFLFPSRWEGMGLAVLEAMAAGVPVLASDLPPLRDVIPTASRLPPDAPAAWRDAIKEVLAHSSNAVRSAQDNIAGVVRRFDAERVTDRYAKVYRELLNPS